MDNNKNEIPPGYSLPDTGKKELPQSSGLSVPVNEQSDPSFANQGGLKNNLDLRSQAALPADMVGRVFGWDQEKEVPTVPPLAQPEQPGGATKITDEVKNLLSGAKIDKLPNAPQTAKPGLNQVPRPPQSPPPAASSGPKPGK